MLFAVAATAGAEVYNCNGTWTNTQCPEAAIAQRFPEVKLTKEQQDEKAKYAMAAELIRYMSRSGVSLRNDLYDVQAQCRSETTTKDECKRLVAGAIEKYYPLIEQAKIRQEEEQKRQEEEEQKRREEEQQAMRELLEKWQEKEEKWQRKLVEEQRHREQIDALDSIRRELRNNASPP